MIRILSLDDEPQLLDIMSMILKRTDCEHLTTDDPYEAWGLLHTLPFHIITQDLMRPGIDGWQFLDWLKAESPLCDVPVAIITAHAQSQSRTRAAEMGNVAAYLVKPFLSQALIDVVNDILMRHHATTLPAVENNTYKELFQRNMPIPEAAMLDTLAPMARRTTFWWMLRFGAPPTPGLLLESLADEDADIRYRAALALGETDSPQVVRQLCAALQHPAWEVRWSAALALKHCRVKEAAPALTAALRDPYPSVRLWATLALGATGDERALDALIAAMQDATPAVRQAAILALAWLHDPRADDILCMAMRDESDVARMLATLALEHVADPVATAALCVALDDSNARVRENAAIVLGRRRDARAMEALLRALHNPALAVRYYAAQALARLGSTAQMRLVENLSDPEPQVRQVVAAALRHVQDEAIIPKLIAALKDEVSHTRILVAQALGNFHGREAIKAAIPALTAALRDKDFDVAWSAAMALRRIGYTKEE
ncbi:MAG TPA: HEAT repeat domain-containing protein [Anaerolineae bacterium]|nr:HEAT repeat domain-containing protein [Anaerolineae bacterium]HQI83647.1 HEAT repeat domain-containing protein [Anaerolineae bacterium]